MNKTLTKSDIQFDGVGIYRELQPDDTYKYYINIGYKVQTVEGEVYNRDKQIELKGAKLTTVSNFFTTIKDQILSDEGVT